LFRSGRDNKAPQRLPRLPHLPTYESVLSALKAANADRQRVVELSWGAHGTEYFLHISSPEDADPVWTLMHTRPLPANAVMQHVSTDVGLICTLIGTACTGESPETAIFAAANSASSKAFGMTGTTNELVNPFPNAPKEGQQLGTSTATAAQRQDAMEGNLATTNLPNVLQSIGVGKMTGRLSLKGTAGSAYVFFEDGEPKHVKGAQADGDQALLELLTWLDGKFVFHPNERTAERTIQGHLDPLLVQGAGLLDQAQYLNRLGLKMESYLIRRDQFLTEAAFEQAVGQGVKYDMVAQKRFYQQIDGKTTLFNLLRANPMSKAHWVPILYNLVSCNLATISDAPPINALISSAPAANLDAEMIQTAIKPNLKAETGIFTYAYFLYSLDLEFHRYLASNAPFQLIIMEFSIRKENRVLSASLDLLRDVFARLSTVKRKIDTLGHFEALDYGLLLPLTDSMAAGLVAQSIVETVMTAAKERNIDPMLLQIAIGVAGIPEDCRDLPSLIVAAKEAKGRAKQIVTPVMLCKNM
jgi:GGDEF domain-containing protein